MPRLDCDTLLDLLALRAHHAPEAIAYTFLEHPVTFGELWQEISHFADCLGSSGLQRRGRVLITLPNGLEFLPIFYAVQKAGGVSVPVFPGLSPERIINLARLCGAEIAVLPSDAPPADLARFREVASQHNLLVTTVEEMRSTALSRDFPAVEPDDLAFIQYTSGSTGNPKGVQLSHRNLWTNVQQMIVGMECSPNDIFVSWLPCYHDLGLIVMTMMPLALGAELHLLPTNLTDVTLWLRTLSSHRATFTAAPDFAYRLVVRRTANPVEFDLTNLRVALNAAEPVRYQTIVEFERAFRLKHVMAAAYGLAEATVGVSMWPPGTAPKVDPRGIVSVGRPFPGIRIRISQSGQPAAPGQVGEIVIDSPANSRGYFANPTASESLFHPEGGIYSGDLGYVDEEGYLYIVGRKKNTIIQAGRTLYPREIEEVASSLPGVRLAAAVGIDRGGVEGEQATIFVEVRDVTLSREDLETMVIEQVQRFQDRFGFRPGRVTLVKPRAIPMTHNGKIRHLRLKERYLQGLLQADGLILFP